MMARRPAMTRMQEGIFTISVIIIVAISILMTKIYLNSIEIPEEFENSISGDRVDMTSYFTSYVEACYRSKRSLDTSAECYVIHITSTEDITKSDLMDKMGDGAVPTENVRFDSSSRLFVQKDIKTSYKIIFDGDTHSIILRQVS